MRMDFQSLEYVIVCRRETSGRLENDGIRTCKSVTRALTMRTCMPKKMVSSSDWKVNVQRRQERRKR